MSDPAPPATEAELLARAQALAGLTLGEIAASHGRALPPDLRRHKGAIGELVEHVLGATAGPRPVPDFEHLGIELKTVPVGPDRRARESTHVCAVALGELSGQRWADSTVRAKLARVLWLPIESTATLRPAARRVGLACLWSPDAAQEEVLRADWEEHMELLVTGRLDQIDARLGTWLQVRPKAADSRALSNASDAAGQPAATLPRGFYLRPCLTSAILNDATPL